MRRHLALLALVLGTVAPAAGLAGLVAPRAGDTAELAPELREPFALGEAPPEMENTGPTPAAHRRAVLGSSRRPKGPRAPGVLTTAAAAPLHGRFLSAASGPAVLLSADILLLIQRQNE